MDDDRISTEPAPNVPVQPTIVSELPVVDPPSVAPEASAAAARLIASVLSRIDLFQRESLGNTRLGNDTELWNHVHSALETLKADVAAILKEI